MLKILCCVKQVPDVDQMRMDPATGSLIRTGVPAILNPQDAFALSAAVKIKETYGGEVTLVTMGPPNAKAVLQECLALGADKAILITDRAFGNADTLATSYSILSGARQTGDYDLILCGKESLDGATGQMPAQLAQRFGAALLSSVIKVDSLNEEKKEIIIQRQADAGVETISANFPCVLSVEKEGFPELRPTILGKLFALKAEITQLTADDISGLDRKRIGDPGSPTKVPRMFPPAVPEAGEILGSAKEVIERLAADGRI